MELRQLRYFVKAAETLNFSEASRLLFITQSTLSQQIRQLEQELDTMLFVRDSHNVELTESGKKLLPLAIKTLQDAETCNKTINDLKLMLSGSLNIGITYTFASIFTETLLSFMNEYPAVKLNVYYKTMEELMQMLSKRELDFVLSFKSTTPLPNIDSHVLFDNSLSVIVNNTHPLAAKDKVVLSDILNYKIALPSRGLQARNIFDQMFPEAYDKLKVGIELNEVNVILDIVRRTPLVTILSEAVIHGMPHLKAIPFDVEGNSMIGCVHTLRNSYRKRATEEFVKILRESESMKRKATQWLES